MSPDSRAGNRPSRDPDGSVDNDDFVVEVMARFICAEVGIRYPSGLVDVQAREMLDHMRAEGVSVRRDRENERLREDLAELLERAHDVDPFYRHQANNATAVPRRCVRCRQLWPCPTARLMALVQVLRPEGMP